MDYDDIKIVKLRENEWRTLVHYTREWIRHVHDIGKTESREDDDFVDAMNDTARLGAICEKISDQT